ncbi:FecR family protein [Pedobacter duraquae]|uniref:FecR family protein n=1 Tax=Pedobacter duraquae TaxID=425511 RepID=A0A4R6IQC5_9SPHI|nr:FecR family protein [Pedobacter duraquae]TDO24530.1 FecR family protein [Pedobacter duraquae]
MKPNKRRPSRPGRKVFIEENFSNEQWESFGSEHNLPEGKSAEMLRAIHEGIAIRSEEKYQTKLTVLRVTRYLSAAVVFLVLGIAIYIGYNNIGGQNPNPKSAATATVKPISGQRIWLQVANTGKSTRKYQLPDSSVVTIYPASNIKFDKEFNQKLRTVYLTGQAKFKVKRNTERPFSVYSGALKTTALGTSFTINTAAAGDRISVKLHTGKIVIANTSTQQALAYISTPGATLMYQPSSKIVRVMPAAPSSDQAVVSLKKEGNVILMKNIPLAEVIKLLNKAYKIQIHANQSDISSITFTGQVDTAKDRAEDVLNMICVINNMTLDQVSQHEFNIQKSNK